MQNLCVKIRFLYEKEKPEFKFRIQYILHRAYFYHQTIIYTHTYTHTHIQTQTYIYIYVILFSKFIDPFQIEVPFLLSVHLFSSHFE